jgi:hypothetical protein
MPKHDFETLLLEAVDEGLSSLGDSSKQAIYYHLKKSFNVKKREIPYKIEAFASAIEKIFGLGANFLEILIMKRLYEKIGQSFKWHRSEDDFTFTEHVAFAKLSFLEKKKRTKELVQYKEKVMEDFNIYETA